MSSYILVFLSLPFCKPLKFSYKHTSIFLQKNYYYNKLKTIFLFLDKHTYFMFLKLSK